MHGNRVVRRQKLLALGAFLSKEREQGSWTYPNLSYPVVLLTQVRQLDHDLVQRLEQVGIYDTLDFENAGEQLCGKGVITAKEYQEMAGIIHTYLQHKIELPRIILDLPSNYLLIHVVSTKKENALAMMWRGMMVSWSCPSSEGWHRIKFPFDQQFQKMGQPQIVGSYGQISELPMWLDKMTDLSTYISNIFSEDDLSTQLRQLGFPSPPVIAPLDRAEYGVLKLTYIIEIAQRFQRQIDRLT